MYQTDQDHASATALAGPFTLREVVVMAGGVLLLLGSVLPFQVAGTFVNLWLFSSMVFNQFLSLALPMLIAGAFAWRRLSGRRRVVVGSLTLDQLGSVVAVLTVVYFFLGTVMSMNAGFLLGLVGALALLAGTTTAPVIPGFAADFEPGDGPLLTRPVRAASPATPRAGRADAPATGASDPKAAAATWPPAVDSTVGTATEPVGPSAATGQHEAVPASAQPRREEVAASPDDAALASAPDAAASPDDDEPFEASRGADEEHSYQAFWFAVPRPREVVDEDTGRTVFTAEPGSWILALEDRGHEYLIQDTDGRIGVLRDLANVERA